MNFKLFLFAFAAFWIKDSQALSPDATNFARILIDASDLPEKIPSDTVTFAKILTETAEEGSPTSNKQQKEEKILLGTAKKYPTLFWDNLWTSHSD